MRKSSAVIACAALCALTPAPVAADDLTKAGFCPSAGAGDATLGGRQWSGLRTRNLSCRKGHKLMKAFARRHAFLSPGSATDRISGYRCRGSFNFHPEGGVNGTVACRKGIRRAEWSGRGLGIGGRGGPGGGAAD